MPCETVNLPFDREYPQRTCAVLLAVAAYPNDQAKRNAFVNAAGSFVLWRRAATDEEWAGSPQKVSPGLLLLPRKWCARTMDDCLGQLRARRLPAGWIARSLLADEALKVFDSKALGAAYSKISGHPVEEMTLNLKVPLDDYNPIEDDDYDPIEEKSLTKLYDISVNRL